MAVELISDAWAYPTAFMPFISSICTVGAFWSVYPILEVTHLILIRRFYCY